MGACNVTQPHGNDQPATEAREGNGCEKTYRMTAVDTKIIVTGVAWQDDVKAEVPQATLVCSSDAVTSAYQRKPTDRDQFHGTVKLVSILCVTAHNLTVMPDL